MAQLLEQRQRVVVVDEAHERIEGAEDRCMTETLGDTARVKGIQAVVAQVKVSGVVHKDHFAPMPFKQRSWREPDEEEAKIGHLDCTLWTVGRSYPVAYHHGDVVKVKDARLGYANREAAIQSTRAAMDDIVKDLRDSFSRCVA